MAKNKLRRLGLSLECGLKLAIFLLPLLTGCTREKTEAPPADLVATGVTLGKSAFQFAPDQTVSLNIAKADALTAGSEGVWSARVEKSGNLWRVTSYSGGTQLIDRLANKAWINHFLETLTTFRADSVLTETDLSHYGLSPPRYAVEWRTQNADGKTATYEMKIGSPVDFEKSPDGDAFTLFSIDKEIYEAGGAAIVMLRYLKSFSSLRLETLSTLESSDVTAIEISGAKNLKARFDGKKWIGRDVSALLDYLTHLRIEHFIDTPAKTAFEPALTIRLTDRYSHVSTLAFDQQNFALNSDRAGAVFKMYDGSLEKMTSIFLTAH